MIEYLISKVGEDYFNLGLLDFDFASTIRKLL